MSEHEHDFMCTDIEVIDMGDDGDGYVSYEIMRCRVTGEEASLEKGY